MKRTLLCISAIALTIFFLKDPIGLIFPMWIVVYLSQKKIRTITDRLPLSLAFIFSGLFFGIVTEFFAILDNQNKPAAERILLHPDPLKDIFMAFFYYGLFMLTWYLLLRKIRFSKKAVFLVSGVFGILSEQGGAIAQGIIASPVSGGAIAFLVMSVYGIFPLLAYTLTKERFIGGKRPHIKHYIIAGGAFFLFWGIYGNLVHKILLTFLEK